MARIPKSCVLALVLGAATLALGTLLATTDIRPLSHHDAEVLIGGIICYDQDGICDSPGWCDNYKCPDVGPSTCDWYAMAENKTFNDQECSTEDPGSENYECGLGPYEVCNVEYNCSYGEQGCAKGSFNTNIGGPYGCSSRLKS